MKRILVMAGIIAATALASAPAANASVTRTQVPAIRTIPGGYLYGPYPSYNGCVAAEYATSLWARIDHGCFFGYDVYGNPAWYFVAG